MTIALDFLAPEDRDRFRPLPGFPGYEGSLAGQCRSSKRHEVRVKRLRGGRAYHLTDPEGNWANVTPLWIQAALLSEMVRRGRE